MSDTLGAVPIAPSMRPAILAAHIPKRAETNDRRILISTVSILLAVAAALVAQLLSGLIGLVTNLAFFGRWSTAFVSPAGHHLGAWVVVVPVVGGLIVGCMARFGSKAIRGHGIPEAMEQILLNESRIAPRITFLKPLSSAIAIGTGGPFGAEGPIIATGGALGSFVGQVLRVTAVERKILLASGAAAGMAAVFGAPLSAVALAVELLLFELRARSLIPVCLAAATATCIRYALVGSAPVFAMPALAEPGAAALLCYTVLGGSIGIISVAVTRIVYAIEDGFAKLPIHWMWWPALGGVAVGVIGYFAPLTFGVGYTNIESIVAGQFTAGVLATLCIMKFLSWSIALGSGTSGGTLAPLFTIGGALGALAGLALTAVAPQLGVDPRIAGLVGMAAMFAGASRALLASIVFAFETTQEPHGLLPLIAACSVAYLVSSLMMRNTIMTEKIARRGIRVPSEYSADYLERVLVERACSRNVISLSANTTLGEVQDWLTSGDAGVEHHGFPVLDGEGNVCGVLTRRDLLRKDRPRECTLRELVTRPPVVVTTGSTLREATDRMVEENVGRLVVVGSEYPHPMIGILTRSDLLAARAPHLKEAREAHRHLWVRRKAS